MIDYTKQVLGRFGKEALVIMSITTALGAVSNALADADKIVHANDEKPGSAINLKQFLATDRQTVLFIHSPHCGDCRRAEPGLKDLSEKRSDLKIVEIVLDSSADKGIGFDTPAAKQFDVHFVPKFAIYDTKGKVTSEGKAAQEVVNQWLKDAKINVTVKS